MEFGGGCSPDYFDHLPVGFLKRDITYKNERFILFCTDEQLTFLFNATVWYVDGTFGVVNPGAVR